MPSNWQRTCYVPISHASSCSYNPQPFVLGGRGGVYDWKWIKSTGAAVIISKESRITSTLIALGTVMRSSAGTSQKVITNGSLTCGPNLDLDPHVNDGRGLV